MRYCPFILVLLVAAASCERGSDGAVPADAPPTPKVADIAADYTHLVSMTKKPVYVNPLLAMLCRGVSQADVEAAAKIDGPHAHTQVRIFMDDLAAAAFTKSSAPYPVGSVIVKEKTGLKYRTSDHSWATTASGVGGMIKRSPGFDPAHGDWEYFYFKDPAKIESGAIASCVQCHSAAAKRDYVFGGWADVKAR